MTRTVLRTRTAASGLPAHADAAGPVRGSDRVADSGPLTAAPLTPVPDPAEAGTRRRVLELIATDGPLTAADLAEHLGLTPAGVRRHLAALEESAQVAEHAGPPTEARRGRPARHWVVTPAGQQSLSQAYALLAVQALEYLATSAGTGAVDGFAAARAAELTDLLAGPVARAGADPADRVHALADGLSDLGYAASVRPVGPAAASEPAHRPGPAQHTGSTQHPEPALLLQLCQGHCPVQAAAARFPQLCEAETQAISRLLGVHVQRLSTLAAGGHVCTTSVPLATASPATSTTTASPTTASPTTVVAGSPRATTPTTHSRTGRTTR